MSRVQFHVLMTEAVATTTAVVLCSLSKMLSWLVTGVDPSTVGNTLCGLFKHCNTVAWATPLSACMHITCLGCEKLVRPEQFNTC